MWSDFFYYDFSTCLLMTCCNVMPPRAFECSNMAVSIFADAPGYTTPFPPIAITMKRHRPARSRMMVACIAGVRSVGENFNRVAPAHRELRIFPRKYYFPSQSRHFRLLRAVVSNTAVKRARLASPECVIL